MYLYKGKRYDIEIFWLDRDTIGWGRIGRDFLFYDCPHRIFNLIFFQVWISGFSKKGSS